MVRAAAAGLPEVEEGTSRGAPALRVRRRIFARMKDEGTVVLHCAPAEKEYLLDLEPAIFFETDDYRGRPAVLVHLARIEAPKLQRIVEEAWRLRAPKRLVASYETARAMPQPAPPLA